MSRGLRQIAGPFVVAGPAGARVRTRLALCDADGLMLSAVGAHLGALAGADLGVHCGQGRLDGRAAAVSQAERKRALTTSATSRWAGAITRTSNDAWDLAERNLQAEARSLRARIGRIRRRLAAPAGGRSRRERGYASRAERWGTRPEDRRQRAANSAVRRAPAPAGLARAPRQETRRPQGPRAARTRAQDPGGRTGIPGRPGRRGPFAPPRGSNVPFVTSLRNGRHCSCAKLTTWPRSARPKVN